MHETASELLEESCCCTASLVREIIDSLLLGELDAGLERTPRKMAAAGRGETLSVMSCT